MNIYTFYFCRDDGAATSFEAVDLPSDHSTGEVAERMLLQHPSCAYVAVWEGDRFVSRIKRQNACEAAYRPDTEAEQRKTC